MKHYLLLAALCIGFLSLGQSTLTRGEVYDYNVGDEFHYSFNNYPGTMVDRFLVLEKEVSQNGDTVHFKLFKSHYFNDPNGDYFQEDTISQSYTDLQLPITSFGDSSYIYDFQQDSSYYYYPDTIIENDTELCNLEVNGWDSYPPVFEPIHRIYLFGRGVGVVRKYQYDQTNFGNQEIENYNLIYYKKGSLECGNPSTVFVNEYEKEKALIRVFPNPTDDVLRIQFNEESNIKNAFFQNIQGEIVSADLNDTGVFHQISTVSFASGFYTLIIELEDGFFRKKVSILH